MSSKFINRGGFFSVADAGSTDVRDRLPPGTYNVGVHPQLGFILNLLDTVTKSPKVYGNLSRFRDRILSTYKARTSNTGVLLEGEKGSGKTMLARMVSLQGLEEDMITVIINTPFKGDDFNKFMQSINQPTIVLFDEFEKVYDEEDQEAILTLLDGVYTSKKLFILTCNETWRIDRNMKNRPGRLFYRIQFKGMEKDAIEQYCQENLENKTRIESIHRVSDVFDNFNFDMLKALVEEMNRYNETATEALTMLNMYPDSSDERYTCTVSFKGEELASDDVTIMDNNGNPLTQETVDLHIRLPIGETISYQGVVGKEEDRKARQPRTISALGIGSKSVSSSVQDLSLDLDGEEQPKEPTRKWFRVQVPTAVPTSIKDGVMTFKVADDVYARFSRRVGKSFNFDSLNT